jgi:hypothetical protein
MRYLTKAICIMAVLTLPLPLAAQGTTRAFDGTYVGVSDEMRAARQNAACRLPPPNPVPPPLTIVNGHAQTLAIGGMEGSVNEQGALVMHQKTGVLFSGQIDAQGTVKGQLTGDYCYWLVVWQKRK